MMEGTSSKDSMMMENYDNENIFRKILQGKIPCNKVYEDEYALAFHDINPKAKVHVLVIPKLSCVNFTHFMNVADERFVSGFMQAVISVIKKLGITDYRLMLNNGKKSGQIIFHMHMHVLSNDVNTDERSVKS